MKIIDLPHRVIKLLKELNCPNRLERHLQIVYSTASELLYQVKQEWPSIDLNEDLILFGAATHDIGKIKVKSELSELGKQHELIGERLLVESGFSNEESRFALTHGNWKDSNLTIEDLLVSLSDKIWKGKRVDDLEERVTHVISENVKVDYWEVYSTLDTILSKIAIGADKRLNWQNE